MKRSPSTPHSLRWIPVLAVALGMLCPLAVMGAQGDVDGRYAEARREYQRLLGRLHIPENQVLFQKNIKTFEEILRNDTQQRLADRCLFMIAQSYHHLYDARRSEDDAKKALGYYKQVAVRFPQSPLADDALFLSGILLEGQDPAEAYLEFSRVVVLFPQGDLTARARQKAEALAARPAASPVAPSGNPKTAAEDEKAAPSAGDKKPKETREPTEAASRETPQAVVEKIQHWSADEYSRVVVYVSGPVRYSRSVLPAEPKDKKPARIALDLERCGVRPKLKPMIPIMDGLLQDVRVEPSADDKTRVILDLQAMDSYRVFSLADPFRVVIDVQGKRKTEAAASAGPSAAPSATPPSASPPAPAPTPPAPARPVIKKGMPSMVEQLGLTVRRIVIDPGHGGKDKGAIGPSGLYEKDITLALAKQLKKVLEKEGGYEVILTRDTDRYVSLEERTAIANTKKADLFLSIHTNAHTDRSVGGIQTYFLNFSTDKESARVAALENAASAKQISDLEGILNELLRNTKINESSRLAREVHQGLINRLESNRKLRDLGVKQAPFYVLLGAQMPSILIEACFISNEEEERLLKDAAFQKELVQAISQGIRSYKDRLAQVGRLGEGA
uniref:N-acetylmuramoyl-L-alanine amidase n=1 Tax=Desulfacinum infernum TaxID=35837 RepID=A0A831ZYK5_9BACT